MKFLPLLLLTVASVCGQLRNGQLYSGQLYNSETPFGTVMDVYFLFAGTNGALARTNEMQASILGAQTGKVSYIEDRTVNHTRFINWPYTRRTPINVNGQVISNTYQALLFDMSDAAAITWEGFSWTPDGISPIYGATAFWRVMFTNVVGNHNFDFHLNGGNFAVGQWQIANGAHTIVAHSEPGTAGTITSGVTSNLWVNLYVRLNYNLQKVEVAAVNAATGDLMGTASKPNTGSAYGQIIYWYLQDYLWNQVDDAQLLIGEAGLAWGANNKFPLEPIDVPTPNSLYAVQIDTNRIRFTWIGRGVTTLVERDSGSGFVTVTNGYTSTVLIGPNDREYFDTNVTEGVSYRYRVTSQVGDYSSATATSEYVLVTNSHAGFAAIWQEQTGLYQEAAINTATTFPAIEQRIKGVNSATVNVSKVEFYLTNAIFATITNGEQVQISFWSQTNRGGVHYATSRATVIYTNTGWVAFNFFSPAAIPTGSNFWMAVEGNWAQVSLMTAFEGLPAYRDGEGFDLLFAGTNTISGVVSDLAFRLYILYTPIVPTSTTAVQQDTNQLTLGWVDTNDGLANYRLDRQVNGGSWVVGYTNTARGATNIVLNGLTDGETNLFRIYAYISGATGSESAATNFPAVKIDNAPFAAPTFTDAIAGASTDTSESFAAALRQNVTCGTTGNCTKLRAWCRTFNFAASVKMALFDSSNNLLGSGTATSISPSAGSWIEVTLTAPVAVTASTVYKIGGIESSTGIQFGYKNGGGGNFFYDFGTTYAAFPPNPYTGTDGSAGTVAFGMGVVP